MVVKLIMFREDGQRREFTLVSGPNTIGRKEDCDIRIPLPEVSRRHAEILVEEQSVVLRDLGAANGTYLNSRRIVEEDLEPGDQIVIGPVVFAVQIDGDPDDDDIMVVRSRVSRSSAGESEPTVTTSRHVATSSEDVDPIAALEALASSADQTAINPDEEQ